MVECSLGLGLGQIRQRESPISKSQTNTAKFNLRCRVKLYNVYKVKLTTYKPEVSVFACSSGWVGEILIQELEPVQLGGILHLLF